MVGKAHQGIHIYIVDGIENVLFQLGTACLQCSDQLFHLGALGVAFAGGAVFCKGAGTLQEFQMVVTLPGNDIFFVDAIQRADQLHSGEMVAVEFGAHGLNLAAVEHAHQGGFDHVGEVK